MDAKQIVNLLFEAHMLKSIKRSGYGFLGLGKESVAEHSFLAAFIGWVMSRMDQQIDSQRLVFMCLLHDLPEARMGDINYVQKKYVQADEAKAIADAIQDLPFGADMEALMEEFNGSRTYEAKLARDADQLAFLLDLKALDEIGGKTPRKWLPHILKRLQTDIGQELAEKIVATGWDDWWLKNYVD